MSFVNYAAYLRSYPGCIYVCFYSFIVLEAVWSFDSTFDRSIYHLIFYVLILTNYIQRSRINPLIQIQTSLVIFDVCFADVIPVMLPQTPKVINEKNNLLMQLLALVIRYFSVSVSGFRRNANSLQRLSSLHLSHHTYMTSHLDSSLVLRAHSKDIKIIWCA